MTLDEFEELVLTVLELATVPGQPLSEPARCTLIIQLLKRSRIQAPSEVAAYREAVAQQQTLTDAVKLAAATGKLQSHLVHGEPS